MNYPWRQIKYSLFEITVNLPSQALSQPTGLHRCILTIFVYQNLSFLIKVMVALAAPDLGVKGSARCYLTPF